MCFYVHNTYAAEHPDSPTSIGPFCRLRPNQFCSSSGTNCIGSIYVATHQEWHLWRGGRSMPSVALSNSHSHPWHRKDSWWVVRRLGTQSTQESIDSIMEKPLSPLLLQKEKPGPDYTGDNASTLPSSISPRNTRETVLIISGTSRLFLRTPNRNFSGIRWSRSRCQI